ncbi:MULTISPECIES: hypothetical protein [unclassified Streptomyces]|uniref:hypothetical protein n=1 Tax=unclassified Streptomyces TaxID=2593676 RepID=UPI00093F350A|nr:hypothetical protein [Streptomyces sp. TSRI0107]OKJ79585.1 hypothetical protein AMK31_26420 [Streptomyces sp. TSRI0107]
MSEAVPPKGVGSQGRLTRDGSLERVQPALLVALRAEGWEAGEADRAAADRLGAELDAEFAEIDGVGILLHSRAGWRWRRCSPLAGEYACVHGVEAPRP